MTLAELMVVMNKGVAEQIGTPIEVFEKPASTFVASFIGSPPMNLIPVQIDAQRQVKHTDGDALQIDSSLVPDYMLNRKALMGIRPEHMHLNATGISIDIEMVEILGSEQLIHGRHHDTQLIVRCPVSMTKDHPLQPGEAIMVGPDRENALHWFDAETGKRLDA
jgi:sn-glycerol 3-phosphate transport system ATP-binding protein